MGRRRDLDGNDIRCHRDNEGQFAGASDGSLAGRARRTFDCDCGWHSKIQPGREAILFLERSRSGEFTVAGWVQGTFRIASEPRTLRETVTQDSSTFAVFDPATRTFRSEGIRRMPVEQFRARVASALRPPTARKRDEKNNCDRKYVAVLVANHAATSGAYSLGTSVGDMRQAAARSGGTSCPKQTRFDVSTPGTINRRWSTSLGNSPVTILTADQHRPDSSMRSRRSSSKSLGAWTGVSGTTLQPSTLGTTQRIATAAACTSVRWVEFHLFQSNDAGFAIGVLAFTRVVSADTVGEQLSPRERRQPHSSVQILDADVLLRSGDINTKFATPAALSANPNAYDLEIHPDARARPLLWLQPTPACGGR